MSDDCACGHVLDEHEILDGPCTIEGCDCVMWEEIS